MIKTSLEKYSWIYSKLCDCILQNLLLADVYCLIFFNNYLNDLFLFYKKEVVSSFTDNNSIYGESSDINTRLTH